MKAVTAAQMREIDRRTIEEFGVPGAVLMERAGRAVSVEVAEVVPSRVSCAGRPVGLVAGKGNNGGDAFVAARLLREWGWSVEVLLAGRVDEVRGDALGALLRLRSAGVPVAERPLAGDWSDADTGPQWAAVVDGVLGTGIRGSAEGVSAAAIEWINRVGRRAPVVAIDIPSGLNADTGAAAGPVVRADRTVTMGLPKTGFLEPAALEWVGSVSVADIGIPASLADPPAGGRELIAGSEVAGLLPARPRAAHKGDYGHVLIMSGAAGFSGAVALAARAGLRSGVGLVSAVVPRRIASTVASLVPEAMVQAAEETADGALAAAGWDRWWAGAPRFTAALMGPGMTPGPDSKTLVRAMLRQSTAPIVLDADALNAFAGDAESLRARAPTVLTPHPGEMGRLLGWKTEAVQADRFGAAAEAAERTGAVVVLKGAGTIVHARGRLPCVNLTGNPGMATGGSGDVLAGLLAGLLAQGLEPWDAARAAVFIHGRAGDAAAACRSMAAMTASDVIEALPGVFLGLAGR